MAAALLWLVPFSNLSLAVILMCVSLAGVWAAGRVERILVQKDPGVVVIDEVAGMLLSVLMLPRTFPILLLAFVCFRVLDIVKPFPVKQAESLPRGWGVMADDLIAGAYTLLLLLLSRALVRWPA